MVHRVLFQKELQKIGDYSPGGVTFSSVASEILREGVVEIYC